MTYAQALILGIVQGLTEFLPVSSSAHLVIVEILMKLTDAAQNVIFDVLLHVGTVLAVLWFYRKDLKAILVGKTVGDGPSPIAKWKFIGFIALSLAATGVCLPFKHLIEDQFGSVEAIKYLLIINAVGLAVLPALRKGSKGLGELAWTGAIFIGLIQAVAVFPGISRSGSTIIAGLLLGLSPREACRYSFLLSIPTILLAALAEVPKALHAGLGISSGVAGIGLVAAIIGGLVAIPLMIGVVEKGKLWGFAIYCAAIGVALIIWHVG